VTIHLGGALLRRSCGLPGSEPLKSEIWDGWSGPLSISLPYLALHRRGLA